MAVIKCPLCHKEYDRFVWKCKRCEASFVGVKSCLKCHETCHELHEFCPKCDSYLGNGNERKARHEKEKTQRIFTPSDGCAIMIILIIMLIYLYLQFK